MSNGKPARRSHFSQSAVNHYPRSLLHVKYIWNDDHSEVVFHPQHNVGDNNDSIDLNLHGGLKTILECIHANGITLRSIVLGSSHENNDGVLMRLASASLKDSLRSMSLQHSPFLTRMSLQYLVQFQHLENLDLSGLAFVDNDFIGVVVNRLPQLSKLNISRCHALTDVALETIADAINTRLIKLDCSFINGLTKHGFNEILVKCTSLEDLRLQSCANVKFIGIVVHARDQMLQYIARGIKTLVIDDCSELQYYSLVWMSIALPDLEHFSATGVKLLDDNITKTLVGGARNLQYFNISHCKKAAKHTWEVLETYAPPLKTLNLNNIQDAVDNNILSSIVVKLSQLRDLSLSGLTTIANEFPQALSTLSRSFNWEKVDISYTGLTTIGVVMLLRMLPKLHTLRIDGLKDVADAAIMAIPSCCPSLRHLYASGCRSVTDEGIKVLCIHARELLTLHVAYELVDLKFFTGHQLTDVSLEFILTKARRLQDVNIANQLGLTLSSKAVRKWFSKRLNYSLQKLDLLGCKELQLTHLDYVFSHCRSLHHVILPESYTSNSHVGTKKFWEKCFGKNLYVADFDPREFQQSVERSKKSQEFTVNTKKASFGKHEVKILKRPEGIVIARPRPDKEMLEYHDALYRRRWWELHAIHVIQTAFSAFRIWKRFKTRIMKRRIVKTYRAYAYKKKLTKRVEQFRRDHAARVICNWYIDTHVKYNRAVNVIIRMFHQWKVRQLVKFYEKHTPKVILIQKRVRGMRVRLSQQYIISQIYLSMPTFWKNVAKLAPSERRPLKRVAVENYQIEGLMEETQELVAHITNDIAAGEKLAPKLPIVVPQPFDKDPYVSLSDGRKLCFYSTEASIFSKGFITKTKNEQRDKLTAAQIRYLEGKTNHYRKEVTKISAEMLETQLPIHIYSSRFWPPTEAQNIRDNSTELFDSSLNGFDVVKNYREPLWCNMCQNRLQLIACKSCDRGYCFFCAFQYHKRLSMRDHQMSMMEPRIVHVQEVEKSLLFHIDNANSAMHDLKYIVKYLRTATEVQRLAKERRLLKEYEKQQEQMRLAFLQAQELYKEKNKSATLISLLYRGRKARRLVREKRQQLALEAAVRGQDKFTKGVLRLQVLIRRFEARMWLFKCGFLFRGLQKYYAKRDGKLALVKPKRTNNKGKIMNQKHLLARSEKMMLRHAQYSRMALFGGIEDGFTKIMLFLKANIRYWQAQYHANEPRIKACEDLRSRFHEEYKEKQRQNAMAGLTATENERLRNEKAAKRLQIRYESMDERLEVLRNIRWWIIQQSRYVYRKAAMIPTRVQDANAQLVWVAEEYARLQRARIHCEKRIEKSLAVGDAMDAPREWIEEHLKYILTQQIALDAQQESLLKDEIARIERDYTEAVSFDALLEELLQCLRYQVQLMSERVALDMQLVDLPYGSEDAIRLNEQLISLKNKQKHLTSSTIDNLKVALQQRYDDHDTANMTLYAFVNDRPDLPVDEMAKIGVVLLDRFLPTSHFAVADYLKVYFLQPWLAIQSVEDIRYEERINMKELKLGQTREELDDLEDRIRQGEIRVEELAAKANELTASIEAHRDPDPDESEIQKEKRESILADLMGQKNGVDAEIDLTQKSNKEIELLRPTLQGTIARLEEEIQEIEDVLLERKTLREKSMKLFFDTEAEVCQEMVEALKMDVDQATDRCGALAILVDGCETPLTAYENPPDEVMNTADDVFWPNCLCVYPKQVDLQRLQHEARPRTQPTTKQFAYVAIAARRMVLQGQLDYYTNSLTALQQEMSFLEEYAKKRAMYQSFLDNYIEELQFVRRQRALENELRGRVERLTEMRDIRLKQLMAAKEEQDRAAAEADRKRAEAERLRKTRFARAAARAKKAIRNVKDNIRDFQRQSAMKMDEEEMRMAKNLREKNKEGVGSRPEAIKEIRFTIGPAKTDAFARENDHLKEKGLPHFVKMDRSIGNQIWLWTQTTFDDTKFITDIALSHKNPENEFYVDYSNKRYSYIDIDDSNLRIWFKASKVRPKGISELRITFTEQEEVRNTVDGLVRLDPSLEKFDLPEMVLWVGKISKVKVATTMNAEAVIAEVLKVRDMIKAEPQNRNMHDLLKKLNEKLEACYKKEAEAIVTNPLQAAIELMALTEDEVMAFMKIFEKIDKQHVGKVTTMDIFEFLQMPPTPVSREIFVVLDSLDENGFVEFGDFVRTLGTYCFFGKEEILRFIYVYGDKERKGEMSAADFERLVETINPIEKLRSRRALKMMKLKPESKLTLDDFKRLNDEYPALFNQLFLLQNAMREKTLGDDWWFKKLSKYRDVRRKMAMEGENVNEMVGIELQRFQEEEARKERMLKRQVEIDNESSGIRKTILQARQLMDELA